MPVLSERVPQGVLTVHQQVFPIQSLHPEIIAVIFIFCLPDSEKHRRTGNPQPIIGSRYTPLLLCNVCSSWRDIAISTPQLWKTFHLDIRRTSSDVEPLVTGIRTWLERSGTLLLTIRLRVFPGVLSSQGWQVLEPLFQCASRWESCHLEGVGKLPCPQTFGALPVLRELNISFSEISFTSAPRLKSLTLVSLPGSFLFSTPWDQLTKLNIHQRQMSSIFLDIILHCPRLRSLSLCLTNPEDRSLDPDAPANLKVLDIGGPEVPSGLPITHRALRYLRLRFVSFPRHPVLESVILPALIELDYSCLDFSMSICPQLFVCFTQSNCQLQRLSLAHANFTWNELLECLKHRCCQTLTYLLIMDEAMLGKELLHHLTYSESNKTLPICPKLTQLELYYCYQSYTSSPDLLGKMVYSRCFEHAQGNRLKCFKIQSISPLSKEDVDLLKLAEEKGGLYLRVGCTATEVQCTL